MVNINNTSNSTNNSSDIQTAGRPYEIVPLCLIDVLILMGNSLVILAYVKGSRSLRTRTNFFVISLAVSDLMVGFFPLPLYITTRLGVHTGEIVEHLTSVDVFFGATSILCLSTISLERMFAVKYPAIHHNLKDKPFYITIATTWLLGFLIAAAKYIFGSSHEQYKNYTLFILMLAFLLPLAVIVCCYVVIFYTARNMFKASNQGNNLSRDIQVAKTISVIIGLFVMCWLPFFVMNMTFDYGTEKQQQYISSSPWLISLTKALHYSNSMMNFFVYAVRSPDFRQAFERLLCGDCSKDVRERLQSFTKGSMKVPNSVRKTKGSSTTMRTTTSSYSMTAVTGSTSLLDDNRLDNNDNVFE